MLSRYRGLLLVGMMVTVLVPIVSYGDPPRQARRVRGEAVTLKPSHYTPQQKEFYLSEEEKTYARPGLNVEVVSVTIPADRKPVVELRYTDDMGQPLDRGGVITPGSISSSFILAWYDGEQRLYTAYTTRPQTSPITGDTEIQASSDSGGSWEDLELGRARYTFGTALPEGYDAGKTHSVAIYGSRSLEDIIAKTYYNNTVYDFRPDGGEVSEVWDAVSDDTCNSCHHQLAFHGGSRRAVKLCVTCHNAGSVDPDTGNTVDMKVMIHKIHLGAELPSVQAGTPYQIIGYRQAVHDYSGIIFPQSMLNCETCHRDSAAEGYIWYSRPTRAACGSCHDDIDWVTGDNHAAGPQADDSACALCHRPEGEREYDISVMGAHQVDTRSSQLAGLTIEILDVQGAGPGLMPTVTFRVANGDGSFVDPSTLSRFSFLLGGPIEEYSEYVSESVSGATVTGDSATYTFTTPLPDDAMGTWALSADVYRFVTIDDGTAEGRQVREAALNPFYPVAITDAEAGSRRQIVDLDKCNVCHDQLALHGGQRYKIEECVICHNPLADDAVVRPDEELPAESIHFKWLIHRIHTGLELEQDFTVYGYRSSVHNYNHVGYPGDRRNCLACHTAGTYGLPIADEALPTTTERDYYSPMQPGAAACLSCHSSVDAAAHAYVNTAPFGEACAACHGDERDHSVESVHAE